MRRRKTAREMSSTVSLSQRRRMLAFLFGVEAMFLLLGWCFVFIGNGLVLAILPLLAVILSKPSERRSFKRPTWRALLSNVAVAALLIGAGTYFLADLGFEAQNLICIALRS